MKQTIFCRRRLLTIPCLLAFMTACGGGIVAGDDGPPADASDAVEDSFTPEPTVVDENFRVLYGYAAPLNDKPGEMLVGNPAGTGTEGNPSWSSDFRIAEASLGQIGLDCTLGCWPDRELKFMAVAVESESTAPGVTIQVVAFDDVLGATTLLDPPVSGVRQARMTDGRLILSRFKSDCEKPSGDETGCFAFEALELDDLPVPAATETLFSFPPAELLEDSMYSGRFRIGTDGGTIILQNPEEDSVTFWLFDTAGALRKVAGPICQTVGLDGKCAYSATAPEMTDDAPVALTVDNKTLFLAYVKDNHDFRLAAIDTANGDIRSTRLLYTPGQNPNYLVNACYNAKEPWPYTRIQQPMLISADGTELVFVAASECEPGMMKSWTNIVAVPTSEIGVMEVADDSFVRNVTDFPNEPVAACVSILPECLDFSPSGRFVVFGGTPRLDSSGRGLLDTSPQHNTDREVFATNVDGRHAAVQISGNVDYRVSSVLSSVQDPAFAAITDPETADE